MKSDKPIKFSRPELHAMLDISLDIAQNDLDGAGGHGISMQTGNTPRVSYIIIAGDHDFLEPRHLAVLASSFLRQVSSQFSDIEEKGGMKRDVLEPLIAAKLKPTPPGTN